MPLINTVWTVDLLNTYQLSSSNYCIIAVTVLGKFITHVLLSQSSVIWYWPQGDDDLQLKKYRQVYD